MNNLDIHTHMHDIVCSWLVSRYNILKVCNIHVVFKCWRLKEKCYHMWTLYMRGGVHHSIYVSYTERLAGRQRLMNVHRQLTNAHTVTLMYTYHIAHMLTCSHAQHCRDYNAIETRVELLDIHTSCSMAVELVSLPPSVKAITTAGSR